MTTLSIQTNWQSQHNIEHWLKHSVWPVLVIGLFLLMPKPWSFDPFLINNSLEVELLETKQSVPIKQIETVEEQPPLIETKPEEIIAPKPSDANEQLATSITETTEINTANKPMVEEPAPPLTSGDILRMVNNRTSLEITPEFEARTGPAKDYFPKQPQVTDWYADIPYLDESVDKPQLDLNFYAEGMEGSIERFFDKITISKTFTTKYGTKIHCALVGVLVSCIWK